MLVLALIVIAACKDEESKPPRAPDAAPPAAPAPVDQPIPDDAPRARLVNVHHGGGAVDVWLVGTRRYKPAQLAAGIAPGQASPWFGVPPGRTTSVVAAGAGADGTSLGSVEWPGFPFDPLPAGTAAVTTLVRTDHDGAATLTRPAAIGDPAKGFLPAPAEGQVVVGIALESLYPREKEIRDGETYMVRPWDAVWVADRTKHCLTPLELPGQRPFAYLSIDDGGGAVSVPAATRTLQLHAEPGCAKRPLGTVELPAATGGAVLVVVHSGDGKTLESIVLPFEP